MMEDITMGIQWNLGVMGNAIRPFIQNGMVYGYDVAANELMDSL